MKGMTTLYCDVDLKNAAKAQKINLSQSLEEILRLKLAIPKGSIEDIEEKKRKLEAELEYLSSAKFQEEQKEQTRKEQKAKKERQNDDDYLRQCFSKKCNRTITDEAYNKILKAYCLKYGCELVQAVAISQSKKGAEE